MAARAIKFEGKTYQFPDDATEQEISDALASVHDQSQGPPNTGLAGVSRPRNPILEDSHNPSSPVYQDSPFHESTSAENLGGWVEEGPIKTGRGVKEMVTPGAFKRGVHDTISGVGTTAAPTTAFAPPTALIRSAVGSYLGSKVGESGAKAWGGDDNTAQMVGDLGGVAGGYVGYKAPDIMAPPVRGIGRVVQRASSMPDLPIDTPSRSANVFSRVVNASRGAISRGGRGMANYKVPQAPNVFEGDASGPLPGEPDLPTPVRPDGMAHHNDVTDHGELDKLLDQVSQQPEVRQGRDSVQADRMPHHDDLSHIDMTPPREPNVQSQSPSEDLEGMAQRQGIDISRTTPVKGTDELAEDPAANIPTPNSDTLLRAIKSAPGWPENGLPNEPWDKINGPDLDSDPYNRVDEIEASRPKRRASDHPDKLLDDLSRGGKESAFADKLSDLPDQWSKLGVDPDSFLRPGRPGFMEDAQDWMNTFGVDTDRSNFSSWVEQGKPGVRPFSRSTDTVGSAQGAADDTNDFVQAKNSLGPDASVSEIAMEAQRLKLKRTGGK